MNSTPQHFDAGHAIYTRRNLSVYDAWVLSISNRWAWRCPTPKMLRSYDQHMTTNHLDVGVGTGYFLDRCKVPERHTTRIALMDRNPQALQRAAKRIARYQPELYQRNVLEPIAFHSERFDSVGCNFLLHCLPGGMADKCRVFDHLKDLMNPRAVCFGSTILRHGVGTNTLARYLMNSYNRRGIFCNQSDTPQALQTELESRFSEVQINLVGCVALFVARM